MTGNHNERQIILSCQELMDVRRILTEHVPDHAVWAFGSRVQGTARGYSDLDIVIMSSEPLSLPIIADLKEAFTESDLVFKVDVVDWATTSEAFRRIIKAKKIVL